MKKETNLKICLTIILIFMTVCLSGCWDSVELNKRSIVSGLGWDLDPKTGEVTFTVQSIVPSEVKAPSASNTTGQQQAGGELRSIQVDKDTGPAMYDAITRLTQHVTRFPFYPHTKVYIFGKEGAQHGIYQFFDVQARNPDSRPNALIVVSAEKKASDIMVIPDGMEKIQAFGMVAEIKLSAQYSKYPAVTVLDFQKRIMSRTTAPIAPIVGIAKAIGPDGRETKKLRVAGTAVFKGGRMIGELNERESSGLLWVTNKVKIGFIAVPEADLEIVKAKSKIIPELQGDKIKITVDIKEESDLVLYKKRQDLTADILRELEKDLAKEIESQVMASVEKSFALDADVFGFGEAVHRKYKNEWKDMKPRWDEIYPEIEVVVKVKTHLNKIGDINKAL